MPSAARRGSWAVVGGAALVGGVRAAMGVQRNIKAPLTLAKHVGQYGWVLKNKRAELAQNLLTKGRHRLGGPVFDSRHLMQTTAGNRALEVLLKDTGKSSRILARIDKASDIASLKNLHKYIGPLSKFGPLLEEKAWIGAGTKLEWLGKSGLARGLGWAGVGFSAVDSVQSFAEGDIKGGLAVPVRPCWAWAASCRRRPELSARSPVWGLPSTRTGTPSAALARTSARVLPMRSRIQANSSATPKIPCKDAGKSVAKFFGFGD